MDKFIQYQKYVFMLAGLIFLALNSFFIVNQTEQAIVLQFGKPVKFKDGENQVEYINTPGLKFKIPFIQKIIFFDNRMLNFEAADKEVLDVEKKALNVNAFAKYKIIDPLTFYEKVTDEDGINIRMNQIFEASLRDAIGSVPLKQMLTAGRKGVMKKVKEDISKKAKDFGIEVYDVRIVRSDLPKENSDSIYKRMYADRDKEAREYRAQGEEEANVIRATADKQVKIILAEANKNAKIIRGKGEAKATEIYSESFGQDPSFFKFYRTMEAYKKTFNKENTKMVLSPNSDFLQYLNDSSAN